jgi:hypothetical protein
MSFMSLAINPELITKILLADGWHEVEPNSLIIDAYEYVEDGVFLFGGSSTNSLTDTGASWREKDGTRVDCPMTAILAVRTRPKPDPA